MDLVDTDPQLLNLIECLWYGNQLVFHENDPCMLVDTWNVFQEINTQSMWMRLLPTTISQSQHQYHCSMGIHLSGKNRGMDVINNVLRATLQLWLQQNEIVHAQTKEGMKGMGLSQLFSAVDEELERDIGGL